jgi:dihydrolipoamide dehydrogenase
MSDAYDVAVIGAGPGGYVAAIRCAQLGLRTVCIDSWKTPAGRPALGGTCLNVGCIPSKALLESSEQYAQLARGLDEHGIRVQGAALDLAQMHKRKQRIVEKSTGGIAFLFRKNKVEWLPGHARFLGGERYRLEVTGDDGRAEIAARAVIVATGSSPLAHPLFPVDGERVVDNTGALNFTEAPQRLGIIGAGVIGVELGSVWRRLGSAVTLLDTRAQFLAMADSQVAAEAYKLLTRDTGLSIQLGAKPESLQAGAGGVVVHYKDARGEPQRLECDRLLVAAGRAPNTGGINADAVGIRRDARGFIEVDDQCRTGLPDLYAIGDCVRGPMLAHKASEEGMAVAERIAGQKPEVGYATIPSVIYTAPEIAWVGQTGQALTAAGTPFRTGVFGFMANGRAQALGETRGFVKVLADDRTDRILGVHMIGPRVSELLGEAVVAMEFAAAAEDLARICHAHPTLSEALREACLAALGRPLHQ